MCRGFCKQAVDEKDNAHKHFKYNSLSFHMYVAAGLLAGPQDGQAAER